MAEQRSQSPPEDVHQIAGALAEAGIRELIYTEPGKPPRPLHARVTDLPAVLQAAPIGAALSTSDRRTSLIHSADGWRYTSSR